MQFRCLDAICNDAAAHSEQHLFAGAAKGVDRGLTCAVKLIHLMCMSNMLNCLVGGSFVNLSFTQETKLSDEPRL